MKKLIFSAVALTMLAAACKKDDTTDSPTSGWKVGPNSYTAQIVTSGTGGNYWSVEAMTNTTFPLSYINFTFNGTSAPAAGSYKVVTISSTTTPAPGQVAVDVGDAPTASSGTFHVATGKDNVNATVTVVGGKLNISLPDIWARDTSGHDSVKVSANITQK